MCQQYNLSKRNWTSIKITQKQKKITNKTLEAKLNEDLNRSSLRSGTKSLINFLNDTYESQKSPCIHFTQFISSQFRLELQV